MDTVLRLCIAILIALSSSSTSSSSASSSFNSNSHDESKCISVDSYATYVCTDNPGATIQAVASSSSVAGDDATTSGFIIPAFAIDVGIEQKITGSESEQFKARNTLRKMVLYMENEVLIRSEYEHVRDKWYVL